MKKLIAVPVVAVIAAVGAASAAGFVGGVSAAPIQSGSSNDLECAHSAKVIEWGTDESKPVPTVENALIKLTDSTCQGQAVHLIAQNSNGSEMARFTSTRLRRHLEPGDQFLRVNARGGGIPVENLKAIRITVKPGDQSMPVGGENARYY